MILLNLRLFIRAIFIFSMNISVIKISVKSPNHFLLWLTYFEIVAVYSILPDLTAWLMSRTRVEVRTTSCKTLIEYFLEIIYFHFGACESYFEVLQVFLFNVHLTCFGVVDHSLSFAVGALFAAVFVIVRSSEETVSLVKDQLLRWLRFLFILHDIWLIWK